MVWNCMDGINCNTNTFQSEGVELGSLAPGWRSYRAPYGTVSHGILWIVSIWWSTPLALCDLRGSTPHAAFIPCAAGGCENTPQNGCFKKKLGCYKYLSWKRTLSKHSFSRRETPNEKKVVNSMSKHFFLVGKTQMVKQVVISNTPQSPKPGPNDLGQVRRATSRRKAKRR